MKPGEIITCKEEDFINANEGLETKLIECKQFGRSSDSGGESYAFFRSQPGTGI